MMAHGYIKILLALDCAGYSTHMWWSHVCVVITISYVDSAKNVLSSTLL